MANQYDTNLKLQAIADAIGDSSSSGLIQALEDIADAVAGGGGGGSSTAGLVSDNFSETDTYDLGDYCIHNNTLYVCINAITTPGPWDLSDWQATNAGLELSSLNSALTADYNLGAAVDLSSYTGTTTKYTIPQEGYLNIQFGTGNSLVAVAYCYIDGNNEAVHCYLQAYANNNKGANQQGELITVKKGFKIYGFNCDNSAANAKLYFIPFNAV